MRGVVFALAVVACAASTPPAKAQFFGDGPCTGFCRFFSGGPADDREQPVREPTIRHRLHHRPSHAALLRREEERGWPDRERASVVEPRRHRRPADARRVAAPVIVVSRPVGGGASAKPVAPVAAPVRIEPAALATPAERPAAAPSGVTAAPLE